MNKKVGDLLYIIDNDSKVSTIYEVKITKVGNKYYEITENFNGSKFSLYYKVLKDILKLIHKTDTQRHLHISYKIYESLEAIEAQNEEHKLRKQINEIIYGTKDKSSLNLQKLNTDQLSELLKLLQTFDN